MFTVDDKHKALIFQPDATFLLDNLAMRAAEEFNKFELRLNPNVIVIFDGTRDMSAKFIEWLKEVNRKATEQEGLMVLCGVSNSIECLVKNVNLASRAFIVKDLVAAKRLLANRTVSTPAD